MYSEWVSVPATRIAEEKQWSVLHKLPENTGRDVVIAVIKPLAANLGISTPSCEPSFLTSDKEVQWCMEVICFGLGLPLSEHEAIRDCVNVYCEWILALTKPKACVPTCICDDPNMYTRKMLNHLYNLFLHRIDDNVDIINRQALYCHRVLRTIETVAQESTTIDRETWDSLLLFLLAINDTLLAPPTVQDDIGSHLCERILTVLIEVWLIACQRCFPSPSLWKTFRELSCSWRHRSVLIDQWNRVNLVLTSKVLLFMYGMNFSDLRLSDEDMHLLPADMSNECVAQAWFRFLHMIGNPIDLCRPEVISQTPKFYHFALSSEMVIDPCQHPCLAVLPQIFFKAMKGIANLVDVFLGVAINETDDTLHSSKSQTQPVPPTQSSTPPHSRRGFSRSSSVAAPTQKFTQRTSLISGLTSTKSSQTSSSTFHQQQMLNQQTPQQSPISTPTTTSAPTSFVRTALSPARPKCNSVLHLFGSWLFEAALVGSDINNFCSSSDYSDSSLRRPSSLVLESRQSPANSMPDSIEIPSNLSLENFEAGQAEAIGALCRIFCAKCSGEAILPVYLARFYLAMHYGLSEGLQSKGQIIASILMNSYELLRQDLEGVMVLVPLFLQALELVLPEREIKIRIHSSLSHAMLRQASIHLLLSMLPLPLHFFNLPIKDISAPNEKPQLTFESLRIRLVNLLINALQVESDTTNTHMLLGGLLFCIQDSAAIEEVEQVTQPLLNEAGGSPDSVNSLLSSEVPSEVAESYDSLGSSECSSLGPDLDNLLRMDFPLLDDDSTHALFLRATYLICHRLISSWKTDLNVSLAALEVLSALARIHLPQTDSLEGKRAVKWICDYIIFQCSRPPPAHSKDLHSTIVAAYQCVIIWLVEHPDLLNDKETVHTVLEVVELGISGSKSQLKKSDPPKLKGDKELKPVSMRVKDAAEAVLSCMLDHVGYFPPPCGPENLSSLLDEKSLLHHCNSFNDDKITKDSAVKHFRYFVLENCIILALLEQHLGNEQDPQPTVTALIRGPFGRHAWCIQLRHLPHHKSGSKHYSINPGRPLPMNDVGTTYNIKPRYFPESVDRIALCQGDTSMPTLDSIAMQDKEKHEELYKILEEQIAYEKSIKDANEANYIQYPNPETECKPPNICQEFQTSRLFLSHLGFLNHEALEESLTQPLPPLMALDQTIEGFHSKIEDLDYTSCRTADTVFILYAKTGQRSAQDVLANVTSGNLHPHFPEFLRSLGWLIDVNKHAGWTGHTSTAWKIISADKQSGEDDSSIKARKVFYWADVSSEMAFVVPGPIPQTVNKKTDKSSEDKLEEVNLRRKEPLEKLKEMERTTLPTALPEEPPVRTLSLNLDSNEDIMQGLNRSSGRKFGRQQNAAVVYDVRVIVVWLENLDDSISFPLADILPFLTTGLETPHFLSKMSDKDAFVIFVHPLQNGLFRVKLHGPAGRMSLALPLVDGMVVSRRTLGALVRQTALNMIRRKKLDADSCQPPHVRRKLKIQDIVNKFHKKMSEPEFYEALFNSFPFS